MSYFNRTCSLPLLNAHSVEQTVSHIEFARLPQEQSRLRTEWVLKQRERAGTFNRLITSLFLLLALTLSCSVFAEDTLNIPILVYHNFNPSVPGSMTLQPARFEEQLKWIKDNGYTVIPLQQVVEYLQGSRSSLPAKSIVITADDGWQSVYKYMVPLVKKYNIPVTLFIYPETISEGKNAMTWDELRELQRSGLFDIQGHTYSHPNFKQEKRRMSAQNFQNLVKKELVTSKNILEEKMGKKITLLAWPFGIYDAWLEDQAAKAGYTMAFSIDALPANRNFKAMAQPRYMIIEDQSMKTFMAIIHEANVKSLAKTGKNEKNL